MNSLLAKYYCAFWLKNAPTGHADRIHTFRWAGRVLKSKDSFLLGDVLKIHTHSLRLPLAGTSLCSARAHLLNGFLSPVCVFPGPISSRGLFWPARDVRASSFESHKLPCFSLFWQVIRLLYHWGSVFAYLYPSSLPLGVGQGILSLYSQCLAQSLLCDTHWDERTASTKWVKELHNWMQKAAAFDLMKIRTLLLFVSMRQSIYRELSSLYPRYAFLRISFLKAEH